MSTVVPLLLSISLFLLQSLFAVGQRRDEVPIANSNCKLPKDRGISFNGAIKAQIKWFFDIETLQCLAFKFEGTRGNGNRFDSIFECRRKCQLPADYGGCSGQKPSARNNRGEYIVCSMTGTERCPVGYRCQMLAFFGVCCHLDTEEMFQRNFNPPKCANGKNPHKLYDPLNKMTMTYLGKNCSDEFCPIGQRMKCHQQEIFAYCCPPTDNNPTDLFV
ncbi:hypothetical protein niasHS_010764 [Heterodera schachtii]|uniref:BPTI/Kunitz inhibitor domain-containing protein n=1 Tax=Heterodera schachtii TaxID=97005 RepID=A0ABD2IV16_HETSC